MPDQEPVESGSPEQTAAPAKSKSHMMPIMGGVIVFVLFTIIFSLKYGVFSDSNVVQPPPAEGQSAATEQKADTASADTATKADPYDGLFAGFDGSDYDEEQTDSAAVQDSIQKINWYQTKKSEIDRKMAQLETERAQLESLRDQVQTLLQHKKDMEQGNIEVMAKLYEGMDAKEVVPILSNLDDSQVSVIISKMKKQKAAEVLGQMDPVRAAKITKYIISMNN